MAALTLLVPYALADIDGNDHNVITAISFNDDERVGAVLVDQAGLNNCTEQSSPTHIAGKINTSMELDGSTEYATCGNGIDSKQALTVAFWVRPDTVFDGGNNDPFQVPIEIDTVTGTLDLISFGSSTGDCADELVTLFQHGGDATCCLSGVCDMSAGAWYHYVWTWNAAKSWYDLYRNGAKVVTVDASGGNATIISFDSPSLGRRESNTDGFFNGEIEEIYFSNASLSALQVAQLYGNQSTNYTYPNWDYSAPAGSPYVKILVGDWYDGAAIEGLNVTLEDGTKNTTNSIGIALFDHAGNTAYNITDTQDRYFFTDSASNAAENVTTYVNVSGAWVRFNASNLLGEYLQNFSACVGGTCNYTSASVTNLLLKPNSTFNVTIIGYDGNHTAAINDTNQTYINRTHEIAFSGQDTGLYNLSGLYQSNLTVNVSIGSTSSYVQNFTLNISGPVNYTNQVTTTYNVSVPAMAGDYEFSVLPVGYSVSYKNATIALRNFSAGVTIPAYALNSFYLTIRDEITRALVTENVTIELISDATAGTYNTLNGTKALELLTPAAYTIRYRSGNYTERDYYQLLVTQNYYNLNLYAILDAQSDPLIITVLDTGGEAVENATVKILRYYTYCNCYETVEMADTAASGEAYFSVDSVDGHYKMSVDYEGVNKFISTSPDNFYSDSAPITRTITIDLGADYYESLQAFYEVGHSLSYNNATGALSFTWSDPSGLVTRGCLYGEYISGVHYVDLTPSCQNGTTGSVVLSLPEFGNKTYRYRASLDFGTTYSMWDAYLGEISAKLAYDFGLFGALMGGAVIVTLALMVSFSAIAVLIVTALGVVVMSALGLVPLGAAFVTGFATLVIGLSAYFMRS